MNYKGQTATHPPHDCNDFRTEVWQNTDSYNCTYCGICNKITKFRFKNTWKHIKMLFWDRL